MYFLYESYAIYTKRALLPFHEMYPPFLVILHTSTVSNKMANKKVHIKYNSVKCFAKKKKTSLLIK